MSNSIPNSADYLIIGAGIHGLSTGFHLAKTTQNKKIVVIDKDEPGAGASGIACGVVRNNYYQPAMRELMAHSVSIWEKYAQELTYQAVGYMQISFEGMREDVRQIYQEQQKIGYRSTFIEGAKESDEYMKNLFHDWRAQGITSVLHEKQGGFANNNASIQGLAKMAKDAGVEIYSNVNMLDFIESSSDNSIKGIKTNDGDIMAEHVVVAPGPWVKYFWDKLDLPKVAQIKGRDGKIHEREMWHYWMLQEGVLDVDPKVLRTNDGKVPPLIHVDSDAPLISSMTGEVLEQEPWGIYYKSHEYFNGIQGGYAPYPITEDADDVEVDPYGVKSKHFLVGDEFIDKWCSALSFCQERFEGMHVKYRQEPSGGLGCFTPDSFPVFDQFRDNVYIIADANHGYKMIGVGALVAEELKTGNSNKLLEPFRFSRYKEGKLHPVSNSPFPWS